MLKQTQGDKLTSFDFLNNGAIVLISKKENPSYLKDMRPISLCNVLYIILVKVLANRLKVLIPDIILSSQCALMPSRLISDYVVIIFEIIHHMKRKTRGNGS